jgi:hypothetical protein
MEKDGKGIAPSSLQPPFFPPPHQGTSPWVEYRTVDGHAYWYNCVTRMSSWHNPFQLLETPSSVAKETLEHWVTIPGTTWQKVRTKEGDIYFYNYETKVSTWQEPPEISLALGSLIAPPHSQLKKQPLQQPPLLPNPEPTPEKRKLSTIVDSEV